MTLTQQFLIITLLPLSFLALAGYVWRRRPKRRTLAMRWSLALLAAAVWATGILRYYSGANIPPIVPYNLGIVSRYALSFTAVLLLVTTIRYFAVPQRQGRLALTLAGLLASTAVALDPAIWLYQLDNMAIAGQEIRHFDLWAAVWITSWLLPTLSAWLLTQQIAAGLGKSMYRNEVQYWLLVLSLFFVGSSFGSISQPGQPFWQEIGVLFVLSAGIVGTVTITSNQLPDLQLSLRRLLSRLSGSLIIFGLTWLALAGIVRIVADLPQATNPNLILIFSAALFAGLFTLIYRLVNELTTRLFMPGYTRQEIPLTDYTDALGGLPDPYHLGDRFLQVLQNRFSVDDASLYEVSDAPGGRLLLRPLVGRGQHIAETADFAPDSPFAAYLRQNAQPLVEDDIESLRIFADMAPDEKTALSRWKRVLYMPIHAGQTFAGLLVLGAKSGGEPYDRHDFEELQRMTAHFAPLLVQVRNMAALRHINEHLFERNQALAQDRQHLQELADLYASFLRLITPELRRPFAPIERTVDHLRENAANGTNKAMAELSSNLEAVKAPIDSLITIANRLLTRHNFNFEMVRLDEIADQASRQVRQMAEARRVRIDLESSSALPAVKGDPKQLEEAVYHLLHNAIKFNKIGGTVRVECGVLGASVYLRIIDTGVGIPEERLAHIWDGLSNLEAEGKRRGPGLGLPLVQFIVAAHGGQLEAKSVYGSGSRFSLMLPLVFDDSAPSTNGQMADTASRHTNEPETEA